MKNKTQAVLGLLFLISFIKSFKFSMTAYDVVFIILLAIIYLSRDLLTDNKTKKDLEVLKNEIDLKFKLQDEEIERAKNTASKNAIAMGFKR